MQQLDNVFNEVFGKTVELANRVADDDQKAGAIQYWLYSRQPCGDVGCEECTSIATAEARMSELKDLIRQFAEESEYYHTPKDRNVGRA